LGRSGAAGARRDARRTPYGAAEIDRTEGAKEPSALTAVGQGALSGMVVADSFALERRLGAGGRGDLIQDCGERPHLVRRAAAGTGGDACGSEMPRGGGMSRTPRAE